MSRTIVKWIELHPKAIAGTAARVAAVRAIEPLNVPRLVSAGLCGTKLRLESARIEQSISLASRRGLMTETEVSRLAETFQTTLAHWASRAFIHGDLSPRNIMIAPARVWFIDWTVDLESFAGTPLFSDPDLRRGRRTAAMDRYAAGRIIEWCRRRRSMISQ